MEGRRAVGEAVGRRTSGVKLVVCPGNAVSGGTSQRDCCGRPHARATVAQNVQWAGHPRGVHFARKPGRTRPGRGVLGPGEGLERLRRRGCRRVSAQNVQRAGHRGCTLCAEAWPNPARTRGAGSRGRARATPPTGMQARDSAQNVQRAGHRGCTLARKPGRTRPGRGVLGPGEGLERLRRRGCRPVSAQNVQRAGHRGCTFSAQAWPDTAGCGSSRPAPHSGEPELARGRGRASPGDWFPGWPRHTTGEQHPSS